MIEEYLDTTPREIASECAPQKEVIVSAASCNLYPIFSYIPVDADEPSA